MRRGEGRPEGFTLIEVMAAVAILAVALTVIAESQQAGMRHVLRAKKMTIATMLAREKMVDLEDELFEEGFSEFNKEEEGKFEDVRLGKLGEHFSWKLKIEKIELPTSLDPNAMSDAITGGDEAAEASGIGGMAAMGGQMLSSQFEMFRSVLEQSIRRVSLEVLWKEGRRKKSISVAAYFTDPRRIDGAIQTGPAIPGVGGGVPGSGPGGGVPGGGAGGGGSGPGAGTGGSTGGAP